MSPRKRAWIPNLVLTAAVFLTLVSTFYVAAEAEAKDRLRFDSAIHEISESIKGRLEIYTAVLRGGRGLFVGSDEIRSDEFRRFVASLRTETNYPGIQGIGFAARVDATSRERIVAAARADGNPDFRIWPEEASSGPYTTIIFLEPQDERNRAALGFDMFSEPVRRAAMEVARDTGHTSVSGKVTLVQEIDASVKQAGFLIYTPIYTRGAALETVEQRREALAGFIYSPFRADDLFSGIFGSTGEPQVYLEIYDGGAISPETLLYRSTGSTGYGGRTGRFSAVMPVVIEGRVWSLVATSTREFERASGRGFATYAFVTGLLISMLLFVVSHLQVAAWESAERIAATLRHSEEALRKSESRLRRLVDSNIVGIVIADLEGHILEANGAFLDVLGYTRDDLNAGKIDRDAVSPPEGAYFDADTVAELRSTGARAPFEWSFRRKDGKTVPVLIGLALLEGTPEMVVGFVLDQTERARAENERVELLERERGAREMAEEANQLKDEFLATVSHELRTPLNAMLGWARLLRAGVLDGPKTARALETIERNAKTQAQLIEDLLDVSRIITGKLRLRVAPVDLADVIEAALDAVKPGATAKGVAVRTELDPSTGAVSGDATRLQQVVWNLLSNAVKFTPPGGEVVVRLSAVDSDAQIQVADTGSGIKPEFLLHVFERFRQEDSSISRTHGGLGLGLAIVRNIVEVHGGTVRAESAGEGRGSVFTVRLPLVGLHIDANDGARLETRHPSLRNIKVLVVDDDHDAQEVFAAMLEMMGATVMTCGNLRKALESVETWRPDVLLSDIAMPDGSGHDLIRAVRGLDSEIAEIPAIAISAYARSDDRRLSIASGFQEHVAKPLDAERLGQAIARVLQTYTAGSQSTKAENEEMPRG